MRTRMNRWGPPVLGVLLLGCAGRGDASAQPPQNAASSPTAPQIRSDRMLADVEFLASDRLKGRDSRNQATILEAANYIADQYREAEIPPTSAGYLVNVPVNVGSELGDTLHFWVERRGQSHAITAEYKIAPTGWDGDGVIGDLAIVPDSAQVAGRTSGQLQDRIAAISAPIQPPQLRAATEAALDLGARGVIVFTAGEPSTSPAFSEGLDTQAPVILMRLRDAEQVLGGDLQAATGVTTRVSLARVREQVEEPRPNVLATLPGTDLAHEIVVLGAHYDHIGEESEGIFCRDPAENGDPQDTICNGADDNASGTAMLLELARALGRSGPHRRTLVFAHFTAEELGLVGSRGLVQSWKTTSPFDRGSVVAMLNMDMVGRYRPQTGLSIGAVSSSPSWDPLLDATDPKGLEVVREAAINARSDHASFFRAGVPVLFFFTGLHPDYHRTSDEIDRINPEGMQRIAELIWEVAARLADGFPIAAGPAKGQTP